MSHKTAFIFFFVIMLFTFVSCHKTCRCYGYDGDVRDFSKEEVEQADKSCPEMVNRAGYRNYYSICEWDN